MEIPESKKRCIQCQEIKLTEHFVKSKRSIDAYKHVCLSCEQKRIFERKYRVNIHRSRQTYQQELEMQKVYNWQRKLAFRQEYDERCMKKDVWYQQQPARQCKVCKQSLPASDFGGVFHTDNFVLHTRCHTCHEQMFTRLRTTCCLCLEKIPRRDFLSHYNGYALSGYGTSISLCCKECEPAFLRLAETQKSRYIRECCQKAFPEGQLVYAEVDPETKAIRYIGRTNQPKCRHAQHLCDTSAIPRYWGKERKLWFTRSNWMQSLVEKRCVPSMNILYDVAVPPLVVEWELRYIWHGIQQGWPLLNIEIMDEKLIARIQKVPHMDFLECSFSSLIQQRFVQPNDMMAFIRQYYGD